MAMEVELDPRHRVLPFKVRAASKESQPHKAAHVVDTDPKNHWSTSTNAKEWLLLELEEPCLLQQIRIHNKSVLEWEISLGLRYKPDSFLKVRTRCEAPRRESQYTTNYAPCRYVRLSCLRGNPIAVYSVQLIGISMPGLEPEFQPLVDHLLPHVTSHKQEVQDLYLQLLREIMTRLTPFLTHLEGELAANTEGVESTMRFLAMLSGPFYPILMAVDERERMKIAAAANDLDSSKSSQASLFTVSSNFQAPPRRSRSPVPSQQSVGHLLAFRPDVALLLLKVAYKDSALGVLCRMVARVFGKLMPPFTSMEPNGAAIEVASGMVGQTVLGSDDTVANFEPSGLSYRQTDYSSLFGEEFRVLEDVGDFGVSALLDVASVEEGLLHFLYASVSKPILCRRLAEVKPDLIPVLPFIQAIVPALRPASIGIMDQPDDSFMPWQAPLVQRAFSQVVSLATTSSYRPLLDGCAGYLSSFSLAHEKAACIIIDLCSGPLAPWLPMVVAKVDLAFELVEGILGFIQVIDKGTARARAALVYVMIGLSGHMDESLTMYKAAKHNLIFIIEMLEPFLLPAITPIRNTIAFGDVSAVLTEKQEHTCSLALDILRAAIKKRAVLPALETEWRKGHVKPSVLLSILAPQLPLPPGIDARNGVTEKADENIPLLPTQQVTDGCLTKLMCGGMPKLLVTEEEAAAKLEPLPTDNLEDPSFFFVPAELKLLNWKILSSPPPDTQDFGQFALKGEPKTAGGDTRDTGAAEILTMDRQEEDHFLNLRVDYLQLVNFQDRELRAAEFVWFAAELHSQEDGAWDNRQVAIDCLLLAAECHLNPFFMLHSIDYQQIIDKSRKNGTLIEEKLTLDKVNPKETGLNWLFCLEEERDKAVIQILLKAAEWDTEAMEKAYEDLQISEDSILGGCSSMSGNAGVCTENIMIDATTLVRKHQNLLSSFLIMQLQKERDNMYETLLQGLLFFLYSATEVSCSPEHVVDVILRTAKRLNVSLLSKPKQPKGKRCNMVSVTSLSLYRQWALLCRLVAAASGGESVEDDEEFGFSEFVYYKELVPASAWMSKIAEFSSSPLPLVRFIGWKGLARYAKSQQQTGIFLASDLQQLSFLLSVFADDLMSSGILEAEGNTEAFDLQQQGAKHVPESTQEQSRGFSPDPKDQSSPGDAANFLYPELDLVCPSLRKQFSSSAQVILDAVCLQLRGVPATALPDILSWFSELCCHPYVLEKKTSPQLCTKIKGYAAANVRFIILRLLEVILVEHMEAIVPELPRVLGVILSLCQSSYCDVSLLDSVLKALKPIISYGVASAVSAEFQIEDDPTILTFESLCFDSLMEKLRSGPDARSETTGQTSQGAFLLFLSGVVLSDLSAVRRLELMHLLMKWANFTSYSGTTSYYNYICSFQKVFEACQWLLEKSLDQRGLSFEKVAVGSKEFVEEEGNVVAEMSNLARANGDLTLDSNSQEVEELHVEEILSETAQHEVKRSAAADESYGLSPRKVDGLLFSSTSDLQEFGKCMESLLFALGAPLETVWKLHPRLAEKLTKTAAHCLMALSFLSKSLCGGFPSAQTNTQHIDEVSQSVTKGRQQTLQFYGAALDAVGQAVLKFQQAHCWQVGACTMDFLLSQPTSSEFFEILPSLSSALQFQCTHAPRVSWRQWTMKWLSKLSTRISLDDSNAPSAPLTDLFRVLLEHREPEQRAGALQQLEKLADVEELSRGSLAEVSSSGLMWKQETLWQCREKMTKIQFFTGIVAATWDSVSSLAARDPSARIRRQAIELLVKFVPLAQPHHLQRLLSSVDAFLPGLVKATYTMSDAPVTRLSLALLSRACLYSTPKEIDMIPSRVWSSLEALSKQRPGSILAETERATCIALLQLREQGEDANQLIQEALSRQTESQPQANKHFASVRESVLEVLARINVIRMLEDSTFRKNFQEAKDLEEAEIELELVNEEKALAVEGKVGLEVLQSKTTSKSCVFPSAEASGNGMKEQFQELRAQILSEERSAIRAEILARRERQRLARHSRQLALEEWTLREVGLLQELDREKAAEIERDIERHRALERERAKTRELRHSLELEAEKRTQRDLQRELEQRESGTVRPSRRDFSGSASGRPRERYRERESGRSGQDSRSSTGVTRENSTTPPATPTAGASISSNSSLPSIMIASSTSRAYPSQSLALSQGHDHMDDRGYDEILDGVGLNGEGGSYGDMDGGGGLDPVGSGGCQRQGSRTSRPRQIVERRERESRREGKWERKLN